MTAVEKTRVNKQMTEIGLFVPPAEDSSVIVMNELAKTLVHSTDNLNLRIFRTVQKTDDRVYQNADLLEKSFLHGSVLRDAVFLHQIENGLEGTPNNALLCPELLQQKYPNRVIIEDVEDINSKDFIKKSITDNNRLQMAVSVRNLGIFKEDIIEAFAKKGEARLLNSHPAQLPDTRGLEGPFWTRMLGQDEYTTSFHVIKRKIDAGAIINYRTKPFKDNPTEPVNFFIRDISPKVAEMIYQLAHIYFIRNCQNPVLDIQKGDIQYFTLPTNEEIKEAKEKGIFLTNRSEQIEWLLNSYSNKASSPEHYIELSNRIIEAYRAFVEDHSDIFYHDQYAPYYTHQKPVAIAG